MKPDIVRIRAERMLQALRLGDRELSVLLTTDVELRNLNRTHRGFDRVTDVLSFEMDGVAGSILGDIAISVETARKQAPAAHRTIVDEVSFLLAHGLLHLLGYDHRTRDEERRMRARTDLLLAAARCG